MLKITHNFREPTDEAKLLKKALEEHGLKKVYLEVDDGYKTIDIGIPPSRINVEVDGIQHLTNPQQIIADLNRGYYSNKNGYNTVHIPNTILRAHLPEIAKALAEAAKIREHKINVHVV